MARINNGKRKLVFIVAASFSIFFVFYYVEYGRSSNTTSNRKLDFLHSLDQTDKALWSYIREYHIIPPSKLDYNFGNKKFYMFQEHKIIHQIFKLQRNGFFVEVGAADGIHSHSLKLEKYYNWSGLLIECNRRQLMKLITVQRKAYISDVCLSNRSRPDKAMMTSMDKWVDSSSLGERGIFPKHLKSNFTKYEVLTVPLYAIMASINVKFVDLIILDIQSLELDVLRVFPFYLVTVKVWIIDFHMLSEVQTEEMKILMLNNGYSKIIKLSAEYVFVHSSMNYTESLSKGWNQFNVQD